MTFSTTSYHSFDKGKCLLHKQINVNIWHLCIQGHYSVNRKKPGIESKYSALGLYNAVAILERKPSQSTCYLLARDIILVSKWTVLFDEQPCRMCLAQCLQHVRERKKITGFFLSSNVHNLNVSKYKNE